jgi:hypothetical protein
MSLEETVNVPEISDQISGASKIAGPTRRSYWLVGLALLTVVALLLGGGTVLSQHLRPKVGLQPAATAHAQEPARFGFILTRLAPQPSSHDAEPAPAPGPEAGATAIEIDPALLKEVEAAYSKFWDIRTEAALNLDISRLSEVMAGPALEREQQQISELQARGVAAVIEGDHEVGLLSLTQDEAELYDEYVNRSYLVDPVTREPVGAPEPEETIKVSFRLQKLDGVWKVVDSERHS